MNFEEKQLEGYKYFGKQLAKLIVMYLAGHDTIFEFEIQEKTRKRQLKDCCYFCKKEIVDDTYTQLFGKTQSNRFLRLNFHGNCFEYLKKSLFNEELFKRTNVPSRKKQIGDKYDM